MTLETVVASEYYEGNSGCMTFSALWVKDHVLWWAEGTRGAVG